MAAENSQEVIGLGILSPYSEMIKTPLKTVLSCEAVLVDPIYHTAYITAYHCKDRQSIYDRLAMMSYKKDDHIPTETFLFFKLVKI